MFLATGAPARWEEVGDMLVEHGASPCSENKFGETAMTKAARGQHWAVLHWLLEMLLM